MDSFAGYARNPKAKTTTFIYAIRRHGANVPPRKPNSSSHLMVCLNDMVAGLGEK